MAEHGGAAWRAPHDAAGIAALAGDRAARRPRPIGREAAGGLGTAPVGELAAAGPPAAVVNPRQVRDFARATGTLAKAGALDARGPAHVAAAVRPVPRPRPDAAGQELAAAVARRRQVSAMLVARRRRAAAALAAPSSGPTAPGGGGRGATGPASCGR